MTRLALLLLPTLAGFLVLGVVGRRLPTLLVSVIGCGSVGLSFLGVLVGVAVLNGLPVTARFSDPVYFTWAAAGSGSFPYGLYWDPLSAVMALVITGVGFAIHVYAVGYMAGDPGYPRFFCYMNLFVLAMLQLVLADNFLWLLVGWGGVGLASYLLIGYWYQRPSAVAAARKAFVVNVLGDAGLMVAAFALFAHFGSLRYADIFPRATELISGSPLAMVVAVGLFIACAAKSAQLPLHVWLPDAMEGPTPVSALIHAATMVTAGVYLIARAYPLFQQTPAFESFIASIGAVTALYAGLVALVQWDIKRVIAYSTISQLGFMFVAVGLGSYAAGMLHLVTHAFFKALLFMAAGAVIHALSGEQDMRRMGAHLRRRLPWTHAVMWLGVLSLAGLPPLSGFFSKEPIISVAYTQGRYSLWIVAVLAAALTALYSLRLIYLSFWAPSREPQLAEHAHEPGWSMRGPMLVLAVGAAGGGWILSGSFDGWLRPVFSRYALFALPPAPTALPHEAGSYIALAATLLAIAVAFSAYWLGRPSPRAVAAAVPWLYEWAVNRGYLDEIYDSAVVTPLRTIGRVGGQLIEPLVVEGGIDAAAGGVLRLGAAARRLQSGYLRTYALATGLGAAVLLAFVAIHR